MKNNEAGFTLIETVLMLFVLSVMLVMPALTIDKMIERTQIDLFFRELTSNITLMQNHSIMNDEATKISFIQNANREEFIDFTVVQNPMHPLNKRMLVDSPYYYYLTGSNKDPLYFYFTRETGNITKSDTFRFRTTQGDYSLTFWLGSGRFEIKKISGE